MAAGLVGEDILESSIKEGDKEADWIKGERPLEFESVCGRFGG